MFNVGDLSVNLRYLQFLGKLGFLPIKVHTLTGELEVLLGRDRLRWCMFALVSQISIAYTAISLLSKVYRTDLTNALRKLLINIAFIYTYQLTLWTGLWTFIEWPKVSEDLCKGNLQLKKAVFDEWGSHKGKCRLREYTLLELATIYLPFSVIPWTCGTAFIAATEVGAALKANSVIAVLFICLKILSELLTYCMCSSSIYWVLLNQILFMSHICHDLDEQLAKLRYNHATDRFVYGREKFDKFKPFTQDKQTAYRCMLDEVLGKCVSTTARRTIEDSPIQ